MKAIGLFGCLTLLAKVTSTVEIQCYYSDWQWGSVGTFYTCTAVVTSLENPTIVTKISGTHKAGRTNADLKGFSVDKQRNLTKIPSGIENFFVNLEGFQWYYSNISTIDSSTFAPFPNLKIINLLDNDLVTLDGDLFRHTRKLRWIDLRFNLLEHVGDDLLTGLTDLTFASFSANPCTNAYAYTPQEIHDLNLKLPIQCPPFVTTRDPPTTTISTTSKPNGCPIRCTLNDEADEMKKKIEKLEKRMEALNSSEED